MGKPRRSLGTKLKKGTGVGAVAIAGLTSIDGLDLTADTMDITTLDSDSGFREYTGGFKDGGEVSISGFLLLDESQEGLYDSYKSGEPEPYTIDFVKLGAKWEFEGVVTGFKTGVSLEDPLSFEGKIKVSGEPTLTITPPA